MSGGESRAQLPKTVATYNSITEMTDGVTRMFEEYIASMRP